MAYEDRYYCSQLTHFPTVLPHDTYARDFGLFIAHKLPYIVGNNLAGIVQAYGPNTPHRYPVDSHIFGFAGVNNPVPDEAGLQQYAALDLPATGAVPASLTDDQLVTLPVNAVTSFIALFHPTSGFGLPDPTVETKEKSSGGSDPASGSIVIIGAGTHVGKLAIQFAKLAGVAKIIGVASVSRSKELEQAGASHVVDRHLPVAEIVAQVHAAAGGANNVTRVYDCRSSTRDLDVALLPVDVPSLFLSLRPIDEGTEKTIKETKPKAGAKLVMGTSEGLGAMQEGFWKELPKWAEKGIVGFPEVRIVKGLDEGEVNGGLDAYRDQSAGKGVVVHPNA